MRNQGGLTRRRGSSKRKKEEANKKAARSVRVRVLVGNAVREVREKERSPAPESQRSRQGGCAAAFIQAISIALRPATSAIMATEER